MLNFTPEGFPSNHVKKTKRTAVVLQQRMLLELKICHPKFTNMEKSQLHSTVDKRWKGIIKGLGVVFFFSTISTLSVFSHECKWKFTVVL